MEEALRLALPANGVRRSSPRNGIKLQNDDLAVGPRIDVGIAGFETLSQKLRRDARRVFGPQLAHLRFGIARIGLFNGEERTVRVAHDGAAAVARGQNVVAIR